MPTKEPGLSLFAQAAAMLKPADYDRARALAASGKKPLEASARDLVDAAAKRLRRMEKRAKNDRREG